MTAASKYVYWGAAIFAGAAVVAALAATLIHDSPHPSRPLSDVLWFRSWWSASAGLSAALSFALVRAVGRHLGLEPLWGRAAILGLSTVALGHLFVGVVAFVLFLVGSLIWLGPSLWAPNEIFVVVLGVGFFSAVYGRYVTLPLGIAAAAFLEWLERRQPTASPSPSSV